MTNTNDDCNSAIVCQLFTRLNVVSLGVGKRCYSVACLFLGQMIESDNLFGQIILSLTLLIHCETCGSNVRVKNFRKAWYLLHENKNRSSLHGQEHGELEGA